MKKFIFATTNNGKFQTAKKYFEKADIELSRLNEELVEPRSNDVKEIARKKVLQAYSMTNMPCFSLDAGFFIETLNGFPGTFVNSALNTIGLTGILKLMEKKENRKCYFKECVAYYDGTDIHYFESVTKGTIAKHIAGFKTEEAWSDLWFLFIPEQCDKTIAELTQAQRETWRNNQPQNSLCKLANFLQNN